MKPLISYKAEIDALCESHKVKWLYAFGSILRSSYNKNSDIDLIVDFKELDINDFANNYYDLMFSLQNMFNRNVDLLEFHAIKNPYFIQAMDKTKVLVYEGWNIEIIGEALSRIVIHSPQINITNIRDIIDTRNRIIHGYDSVSNEIMWSIIIEHIPILQAEITRLLEV
jgi:hypothetical protein